MLVADFDDQGQWNSGQLCLVLVRPDRQTTDTFFLGCGQNRDRQNPDIRQTPNTIFRKIRTKTRQGQDTVKESERVACPVNQTVLDDNVRLCRSKQFYANCLHNWSLNEFGFSFEVSDAGLINYFKQNEPPTPFQGQIPFCTFSRTRFQLMESHGTLPTVV